MNTDGGTAKLFNSKESDFDENLSCQKPNWKNFFKNLKAFF